MSASFQCRCGRRVLLAPDADDAVKCPACGRTSIVVRPRRERRELWLAAATAVVLLAIAGVGILIASQVRRSHNRDAAARAEEPAAPKVAPPQLPTPSVQPVVTPDVPVKEFAAAPEPQATLIAPLPREVLPPVPVVPVTPSQPVRVQKIEPVTIEPPGRYKLGSTFGQEVVVTRRSAFRVAGMDFTQGSQYAFASSFAVIKVNADGSLVVEQTIVTARLIDADQDLRVPLAAALVKAKGTKFELTISATGEVTGLTGLNDPINVLAGKDAALGDSLRIWSLLDADAWKELAGLTFFQPEKPLKVGMTWSRPEAHDWGALGTWRGKTLYAPAGKVPGKAGERIDYKHDITYRPPAAGADANLPIRVVKSEFKTVLAGGAILYDPAVRRVTAVEETFRVRGAVLVSLGGIEAGIEMEELQSFKLTVTEQVPREVVGPGANRPK